MVKNIAEQLEKNFYKWVIDKRYKLILILIISLVLSSVSNLPYINLVFSKDLSLPLIFFIAFLIFDIKPSTIIKIGIFLLLPAFIFLLLDRIFLEETIG
ncbi:MAG: hypothetical protein UU66_C0047G0013, partial [Parcubacteria group bacterium GW2011_GWB1_41_5]